MEKELSFDNTKNKNKNTNKELWNAETKLKEINKLV